jgi:hypothetical protein
VHAPRVIATARVPGKTWPCTRGARGQKFASAGTRNEFRLQPPPIKHHAPHPAGQPRPPSQPRAPAQLTPAGAHSTRPSHARRPPIWSSLSLGSSRACPRLWIAMFHAVWSPLRRPVSALYPTFLWFGRHPVALDFRRSTLRRGAEREPRTRLLPCAGTSRWPAPSSPPLVPGRPSSTGFPPG